MWVNTLGGGDQFINKIRHRRRAVPADEIGRDFVRHAVSEDRRVVRAGDTRENRVAIVEGVEPGETIVSEGQLKLQSGARVRIDPAARLEPPPVRPKE